MRLPRFALTCIAMLGLLGMFYVVSPVAGAATHLKLPPADSGCATSASAPAKPQQSLWL
jgi:hypothetical protein